MKALLNDIGISNTDGFIYEYEPIKLDWWDDEKQYID